MLIKIVTFKLDDPKKECISEMRCNILKPEKQEWLISHLIWAGNNKCGVQIYNNADSEDAVDLEKQADYEAVQAAYRKANGLPERHKKSA